MSQDILMVDDDPAIIQFMGKLLAGTGQHRFATDGVSALRLAREQVPDLVLLDADMPGMSGFDVCQTLKADPALSHVPVIFVTSHRERAFEVAGLHLGADDYITKPFDHSTLVARVEARLRVKRQSDALRRLATLDSVTELIDRSAFDETVEREWRRSLRDDSAISLMVVSIDSFSRFADRYGQSAADSCLRAVAQALLRSASRPADLVARFGPQHFGLVLPQTPREGGEHVAHRVLDLVEALAIPNEASTVSRHVTVSVGLAYHDEVSSCWGAPGIGGAAHEQVEGSLGAQHLVAAAETARRAAAFAGRAQAWHLDIADAAAPGLAREVDPLRRKSARHDDRA